MVFQGFRVDEDVLDARGAEDVPVFLQYVVDELLEGSWDVGEAGWYSQVFEVAKVGSEGRLLFFALSYSNSVVSSPEVELG